MTSVYLSLGANMGDREAYFKKAIQELSQIRETELIKQSSLYETAAWGKEDQADFLNMACQLETSLSPDALLEATQAIERDLGRVRHEKWGPRTIDIDILLFGDRIEQIESLTIPHPYMTQRSFVLIPLLEINPKLTLPPLMTELSLYLKDLNQSDVKWYKKAFD
ncbi:2-amino-4-hydroxy-6-hydroxymethyldihydropteridine diphosphokinase [Streptococcus ictaluri]|uniref:2-amino-4-hydroxy-6-hydroxymethyldihydropteridine diphosphokinase n=1 Tax=Streptococcus ictaluri 707-05 TaxID=764299 RepID=G5K3H5_9STRE|nr:2-amino-4-hydroxy-6-hydroxymethyldihydropteridine diphosphokinase [Streptococcus ictaluri]EHI69882.1 2-amino-4-hydroxy-6-hydroxymethyldihydropteridine diphosphokinase [Streptococcus ictaluri 707-05]